jgi:hypothetical protein
MRPAADRRRSFHSRPEEEHRLGFASSTVGQAAAGRRSTYLDDLFLERVRGAYRLSASEDAISTDSMWKHIATLNQPVHDALMAADNDKLRRIFADPSSSDLYYGVDNLARSIAMQHGPEEGPHLVEQSRECVLLLAEAIGIRRWLPPETEHTASYYPPGHEVSPDIEDVLEALSQALGFNVRFPNPFHGEVGISTSRGTISYRAVQSLYQCHRIKQELAGATSASVLEIGPGMGRTAYFARQAGILDYTTIDLPLGVVGQACFLGATLGPEAIWMVGDDPKVARGRIRLLPNTMRDSIRRQFALVLNVDSLTETGSEASASFAVWIATHAKAFLSINHEANGPTVADLGRRFFPGTAYRRSPYWLRPGYVEESFVFGRKYRADGAAPNLRREITGSFRALLRAITG